MAGDDTTIAAVVSIIGCLTGLVTALACFYKPFTENCGYLMDRESNHKDLLIEIEDVKEVETSEGYSNSLKRRAKMLVKEVADLKIEEKINKKCLFVVPDICSRFYIARRIGKTLVRAKLLNDEKIKGKNKSTDEVPPQAQEAQKTQPKVEDKDITERNKSTDEVPPQALEAQNTQPKVEDGEITERNKSTDEGPAQANVEQKAQPKEKDAQNVKLTGEQESKPIEDDAEKNKPTGEVLPEDAQKGISAKVLDVWRKNKIKRGKGIIAIVIGVFLIAGFFYFGIVGIVGSVINFIFLIALSCLPEPLTRNCGYLMNQRKKFKELMENSTKLEDLSNKVSNQSEPKVSQWKDSACKKILKEEDKNRIAGKIEENCQIGCLPDISLRFRIGRLIAQENEQIKEALREGQTFIPTTTEKSISSSLSSSQCQTSTTLVCPKTNDAIDEMWRVEMMAPLGCSSWTVNFAGSTEIASMEPGNVKGITVVDPSNCSRPAHE